MPYFEGAVRKVANPGRMSPCQAKMHCSLARDCPWKYAPDGSKTRILLQIWQIGPA